MHWIISDLNQAARVPSPQEMTMLTQHIMQQVAITSSTFDNRDIWSGVEIFIIKNNIWNDQGLLHTIPQTFTQRHLKWGEDNNYNNGLTFSTLHRPWSKESWRNKKKTSAAVKVLFIFLYFHFKGARISSKYQKIPLNSLFSIKEQLILGDEPPPHSQQMPPQQDGPGLPLNKVIIAMVSISGEDRTHLWKL